MMSKIILALGGAAFAQADGTWSAWGTWQPSNWGHCAICQDNGQRSRFRKCKADNLELCNTGGGVRSVVQLEGNCDAPPGLNAPYDIQCHSDSTDNPNNLGYYDFTDYLEANHFQGFQSMDDGIILERQSESCEASTGPHWSGWSNWGSCDLNKKTYRYRHCDGYTEGGSVGQCDCEMQGTVRSFVKTGATCTNPSGVNADITLCQSDSTWTSSVWSDNPYGFFMGSIADYVYPNVPFDSYLNTLFDTPVVSDGSIISQDSKACDIPGSSYWNAWGDWIRADDEFGCRYYATRTCACGDWYWAAWSGCFCEGPHFKYERCNNGEIDGAWGPWSSTCSGGQRQRACDDPKPSSGGAACEGDSTKAC